MVLFVDIKTFPVAAAAYRESNPKSFLTHSCEVSESGHPISVLCKRVKFESILEDACVATEEAPTCPACVAKLARIKAA